MSNGTLEQGFAAVDALRASDASRLTGLDSATIERLTELPVVERIPLGVRVFEVCVALAALVLAMPLMLIIGAVIKRGTPGRVLFFQSRVGVNCRPFRFVKFRTLFADG